MGQVRAFPFSHGLSCVVEEEPPQDNEAAAAEQRRRHILASMAKLEGHSPANVGQGHFKATTSLSPHHRPLSSTKSQVKASPAPQQSEPFPPRQSFTGFVPTPPAFPYFYYYPVYPANFMPMPMPTHYFERNSMSFNPSLDAGSTHFRHLSAPIHNQRVPSQDLTAKNMLQEGLMNSHYMQRRHTRQSDIMRTPEKSCRSRSTVVSTESSPESPLPTPPILKYHSSSHNYQRPESYPKLQFSETGQDGSNDGRDSSSTKKKWNQVDRTRPVDQRSNESSSPTTRRRNNKVENLTAFSHNHVYGSQLESKKTGVKLIEKERLTLDEVKALQTLPPLPPRPDYKRASLVSVTKKEKKDPFAWFRYCEHLMSFNSKS